MSRDEHDDFMLVTPSLAEGRGGKGIRRWAARMAVAVTAILAMLAVADHFMGFGMPWPWSAPMASDARTAGLKAPTFRQGARSLAPFKAAGTPAAEAEGLKAEAAGLSGTVDGLKSGETDAPMADGSDVRQADGTLGLKAEETVDLQAYDIGLKEDVADAPGTEEADEDADPDARAFRLQGDASGTTDAGTDRKPLESVPGADKAPGTYSRRLATRSATATIAESPGDAARNAETSGRNASRPSGDTQNDAATPKASAKPRISMPEFGNLAAITKLTGEREELKIAKEIALLKRDIAEATRRAEGQSPSPASPPAASRAKPVAPAVDNVPVRVMAPRPPRILSIQGMDGACWATVRLPDGGTRTLRSGEGFEGATVIAIDRRGVRVRRADGREELLPVAGH
ncbi:MAG: type IV pilus biogenesis protein PilP [Desulfovibrio sp.]|jgi:type IV pilus biogenesis protein PilP|nr:type IV pilus biogenesis protein PilP [Desulfovibrio sp.]